MIDIENYLNNFNIGTKSPNLDGMKYFIKNYNNFEKKMKFIHIAGTNGKGSCTEMITNILVKQGYKVGKYMSPHLIKYNERISINNKNITDEEMSNLIEELQPLIYNYNSTHKIQITLFELETIMALLYFYRNKVDVAVLETGLGGLYDCTNIITKPICSIITSIGYDHTNILGNTSTEIAKQKAGIIKENSETIIFEQDPKINEVFINECSKKNNKLHIISKDRIKNYRYNKDYQFFDFDELNNIAINLKGKKQVENASICIECIKVLNNQGYEITEDSLRQGLSTVIHKGRMEVLNNKPLIIYDGAHNEPAIKNLQNTVEMYYSDLNRVYIVSIFKRKDYDKMIKLLLQDEKASFIFTSGNDESYATGEELYETALKYRKNQDISIKTLKEAIQFAMQNNSNKVHFVVGSFYVYGDVVDIIKNE